MNKRDFLRALLVAAVAPAALVPKAIDRYRWVQTSRGMWMVNPAWVTAQFKIVWKHPEPEGGGECVQGFRYNHKDGEFTIVPQFTQL